MLVEKIEVDGDCWVWTGTTARGRPYFTRGGRNVYVARWVYDRYIGPIPNGTLIHHTCLNKLCINPDHLQAVTPRKHQRLHLRR